MGVRNSVYIMLFGFLFFNIVLKLPFSDEVKWIIVEFKPMVRSVLACYCILLILPKEFTFEIGVVTMVMAFDALQFLFCVLYTIGMINTDQTNYVYPVYLVLLLLFVNKIFKKAEKESL